MGKLKTFFYILRQTFTSIDYYGDILKAPVEFSIKFFWVYFLCFSIIATGIITIRYYVPLNDYVTNFLPAEIVRVYPQELEITIKDGAVSTNVTEPYFIPISILEPMAQEFEDRVLGMNTMNVNNILVIDTMANIEDFPQYQTMALLTQHHLSIMNEDGNIETIPLNQAENLVINQQIVNDWITKVSPYLRYLLPILVGFTFLVLLTFLPLWKMLYAVFLAMILQLIARILKYPIIFKKAWQLELHFLVISTTFFSVWRLIGVQIEIPLLETMLISILGWLILRHLPRVETESKT